MWPTLILSLALTGQSPVAPPANAVEAPGSTWSRFPEYPGWELFGARDATGWFRYSKVRKVNQQPPAAAVPFGVNVAELAKGEPNSYRAVGPDAQVFAQAAKATGDGIIQGLEDDRHHNRLTITAAEDVRSRVRRDLEGPLKDAAAGLLVQYYQPGHWATDGVGLPGGLVLQSPPDKDGKGKVLWRSETYDGPDQLKAAIQTYGAIRRPNQDYDPALDQQPGGLDGIPEWAKILGFGLAALLLLSALSQRTNA